MFVFFFKQKTAYEMRISDWSSDVCSSDLNATGAVDDHYVISVLVGRDQWDAIDFNRLDAIDPAATLNACGAVVKLDRSARFVEEIGRASCRERVCQYV